MHEDRPRLVKVTYTRQKDQGSGVTKLPDFTPWLPCKWRDQRLITSHGMQGRGRPLGRTLQMEFNDDYMAERSPINRCVQAVTNGEAEKWGDNILVFRRKGSNNYADATMDDVEPMVAYFKDYNWKNLCVTMSSVCSADAGRTCSGYESPEAARKLSIQMLDPSMFV